MEVIKEILSHYSFENPKVTFIRHSENKVYALMNQREKYLIRIHEPKEGFSLKLYQKNHKLKSYIQGEMDVLSEISKLLDKPIQEPILNKCGEAVTHLSSGLCVTILKWLEGDVLSKEEMTVATAKDIGELLAELHGVFKSLEGDVCVESKELLMFNRYYYNKELIIDLKEELKLAELAGQINTHQLNILTKTLSTINKTMDELSQIPFSAGLVHADVALSNIIKHKTLSPIDFSLCGYGYYLMDIGSAIANVKDIHLRKSIIEGYEAVSKEKVFIKGVESFFAFGVILFIACQHDLIHKESWFQGNMKRWEETIFTPVNQNKRFALI